MSQFQFIVRSLLGDSFQRKLGIELIAAIIKDKLGRFKRSPVAVLKETALDVGQVIRLIPTHFTGLSSLSGTIATNFKWTAQNNLTGSQYNPTTNPGNLTKSYDLGTAAANNASGGADEIFSFQQAITAGSSATVDLNAMTNILAQASVAIVAIKGYQLRLLNVTDDSTITTPVATSITATNSEVTLPTRLDFGSAGSGLTLALTQSGGALSGVSIGAAGTGYKKSSSFLVAPVQASGSAGSVTVVTNGSGVPTAVAVLNAGAGYSNATVPSAELGSHTILSGGAHMYFDVSSAGFATVSSTIKNLKIANNDGSNTATFELDIFAATS